MPLGIFFIASFKVVKATLLIALGVTALILMQGNAEAKVDDWIDVLRLDPTSGWVRRLTTDVAHVDVRKLGWLTLAAFAYALLFATEGIGLFAKRRWAEGLTLFITVSFLPFEIYELAKHVNASKIAALVINIAAILYLLVRRRSRRRGALTRSVGAASSPYGTDAPSSDVPAL